MALFSPFLSPRRACCPARISWSRRRSRPTSKGGAQCPVQQSIRSRDSASRRFVCHCPGRWAGLTAIEHGPAISGDMEVETGAVPSRTVMHDPRERPVRWVVPSSDSVVDDPKGILGGVIFALAASDGTPSIQSCSSATLTKPLPLVCTAGLVPLWSSASPQKVKLNLALIGFVRSRISTLWRVKTTTFWIAMATASSSD